MDQVALKSIEDAVFQFDIKRYIDNTTKTDEEINEKYLKGEVRIVTEQARYPLSTIKDMFNGKDYILNPDFQRRLRWDRIKQSKLIESFIINVPIPPIFLYEKPEILTREEKRAWLDTLKGVSLGSDAFFPFGDNIERAHKSGVDYIAQAGGSVRDDHVIDTCDKYGIAMAFTGVRLFHH